jgi:predicted porin
MKKSLIALAVGAAFVAPVASADVTLSGSINAGPAIVKTGEGSTNAGTAGSSVHTTGTPAAQSVTRTGINTNYSNVTIGSMEDLGGGLKLDFAYQLTANFDNSANAATNRNSHIGLVGDSWGGVWYGTNENLYERYYYTIDPLDGAAGIGGNLSILGTPGYNRVFETGNAQGATFYRRTDDTIWYDSPNWGGFTLGAYTTLSRNKAPSGSFSNPHIYGFGGKYVGPTLPIQAWVAYEAHKDLDGLATIVAGGAPVGHPNGGTSSSDHGLQVGAGYTLGDVFIFANFEQLKYESDGVAVGGLSEYKRNAYSVGVKWNIATGYVGAQYMQALNASCTRVGGGCSGDETGARSIGVGYYHTLSKQTQAYIMAQYINNGDLNIYTVAGGVGTPANLGANVTAATIGLKHSF